MFRKSKNGRRHRATPLRIEQLENRQRLAGDLVAGVDTHGNLNIVGSNYEDFVTDICRVWNHTLTFKSLSDNETEYTDRVVLYAGGFTGLLANG